MRTYSNYILYLIKQEFYSAATIVASNLINGMLVGQCREVMIKLPCIKSAFTGLRINF